MAEGERCEQCGRSISEAEPEEGAEVAQVGEKSVKRSRVETLALLALAAALTASWDTPGNDCNDYWFNL